jgi:CDP-paratose 2-epimerase
MPMPVCMGDNKIKTRGDIVKIIVTGSSGLIGSSVCEYFSELGWTIHGIDNNQRAKFFGPQGDTRWNQKRLENNLKNFIHHELDIRNREGILKLFERLRPDAIVHCAAQPSHDKAVHIPFDDFDTNAVGTFNLLEATRTYAINSPFVFMSTNKVYGDSPNNIPLVEYETRWDYEDPKFRNGISESFCIDQCTHSLFGASKVAADILTQEYGRYFNMKTCCLRGGCLTGPSHSGVELHGFLSYLVRCNLEGRPYNIFGYKGKQVRDNIHSRDVANFIYCFINNPRIGEVYNLGGGKNNTCSIIEAISTIENLTQKKMSCEYQEQARVGDHICYYSDLTKIYRHYPEWKLSISLNDNIRQIVDGWIFRLKKYNC